MNKLLLLPVATFLAAAIPASAASGCDGVIAATMKVYQVPAHLYMTRTAGVNGGKTENSESVYLNGAIFVMVRGKWVKSSVSPKDLADSKKESDQKLGSCTAVRDELVGGEPATLYKVHSESPEDKVDAQVWISKLRGLLLKQVNDLDVGGAAGKSHTEIRYEYSNVSAPAVTETKGK